MLLVSSFEFQVSSFKSRSSRSWFRPWLSSETSASSNTKELETRNSKLETDSYWNPWQDLNPH